MNKLQEMIDAATTDRELQLIHETACRNAEAYEKVGGFEASTREAAYGDLLYGRRVYRDAFSAALAFAIREMRKDG